MPIANCFGSRRVAGAFTVWASKTDDVGLEPVPEEPAVGQPQALRGERGHLPDGLDQPEPALLADELPRMIAKAP
jgi:hypothetical protein